MQMAMVANVALTMNCFCICSRREKNGCFTAKHVLLLFQKYLSIEITINVV